MQHSRPPSGDRFFLAFLLAWICGFTVISATLAGYSRLVGNEFALSSLPRLMLVVATVSFPLTLFLGLVGWLALRRLGFVSAVGFSIIGIASGLLVAFVLLRSSVWSESPTLAFSLGGLTAELVFHWAYYRVGSQ